MSIPKRHSADPHAPPTKTTACCGGSQEPNPRQTRRQRFHTKPAQGPGARNRQTTLILSFLYPKIPPTHPSIAARKAVRPARKRDSGKITTSPSSPPTTPSERDYRHPSCCDERISGLLWILAGLRLKRDSISTRWIDCDCCVVYCVGLQDCCCCFGGN